MEGREVGRGREGPGERERVGIRVRAFRLPSALPSNLALMQPPETFPARARLNSTPTPHPPTPTPSTPAPVRGLNPKSYTPSPQRTAPTRHRSLRTRALGPSSD